MIKNNSKYGIYSILIGIIGWCYLLLLSYLINYDVSNILREQGSMLIQFLPVSKYQSFWFQIISIGIGIVGIYFGIKAILRKTEIGILGILISLSVILMSFYPLGNLYLF